jgi:hypothetical protein
VSQTATCLPCAPSLGPSVGTSTTAPRPVPPLAPTNTQSAARTRAGALYYDGTSSTAPCAAARSKFNPSSRARISSSLRSAAHP